MEALSAINFLLAALFAACYCYQAVFLGARLLRKRRTFTARKLCRYAVLIAARNESAVIAQLLESIRQQDYPQDLLDIYVVADNCTDGTASIAREHGARVFERQNKMQVGKGYALAFLLEHIREDFPQERYDGYFVFDADNLLDPHYVTEMNKVFSNGNRGRNRLPQHQKLWGQLDHRGLWHLVFAGVRVPEPPPRLPGHQLRRVRHGLPLRPGPAG